MQILEQYDPLNLPRGSVRSIVTLALVGVLWAVALVDREVPLVLGYLVLLALGHYFGARPQSTREGRQPLFLPRGSVRLIIVAGFCVVGYVLATRGQINLTLADSTSAIFIIAAAMFLGVLLRLFLDLVRLGPDSAPRRWFENLKAALVVTAVAAIAIISFVDVDPEEAARVALIAAPLIVFYFGSRK